MAVWTSDASLIRKPNNIKLSRDQSGRDHPDAYNRETTPHQNANHLPRWLTIFGPALMRQVTRAALVAGLLIFCVCPLSAAPIVPAAGGVDGLRSQASEQIGKPHSVVEPAAVINAFPTAWWNWIFVSLFAFFGCGQFVLLLYQSNLNSRTLGATQRAVDLAERTAADFEAPFLFPVLLSSSLAEDLRLLAEQENPDAAVSPRVAFTIKNFGRTPALLQRASAVFFAGELEEAHNDTVAARLPELMLEPLGSLATPLEREIEQPIIRSAVETLNAQNTKIYLRGRVTFLDVLGNRYEQIFCFAWDMETRRFIPSSAHRNRRKRLSSRRRRLS